MTPCGGEAPLAVTPKPAELPSSYVVVNGVDVQLFGSLSIRMSHLYLAVVYLKPVSTPRLTLRVLGAPSLACPSLSSAALLPQDPKNRDGPYLHAIVNLPQNLPRFHEVPPAFAADGEEWKQGFVLLEQVRLPCPLAALPPPPDRSHGSLYSRPTNTPPLLAALLPHSAM